MAETLQRSLLPQRLPRLDRLALAARYLPGAEGTQAGGDWYDVVELDGNRVAIAVGDVVGQGPAAAAVMGQLRSALSTALISGCSPAEALELLDRFATRLPGATASTAAATASSTAPCTGSPSPNRAWTPRPPPTLPASRPRAGPDAKRCAASSATSPAASSSSCTRPHQPRPRPRPRHSAIARR